MRKALNENPVVQVVMLGVLGIVVAFVFMTQIMGGDEPAPGAPTSDAAAPASAADPVASAAVEAVPPSASVEPTGAAPEAVPAPVAEAGGFEPGPGLPRRLVAAYSKGDVVVLMIQQEKGIDDRELRQEVERLRSRGDTTVFIAAAQEVSDYSRVTQGVDLDRIPAIVVIHPKQGKTGPRELPVASVSYGYRGQQSVEQVVRDALYDGKQLPYHPG